MHHFENAPGLSILRGYVFLGGYPVGGWGVEVFAKFVKQLVSIKITGAHRLEPWYFIFLRPLSIPHFLLVTSRRSLYRSAETSCFVPDITELLLMPVIITRRPHCKKASCCAGSSWRCVVWPLHPPSARLVVWPLSFLTSPVRQGYRVMIELKQFTLLVFWSW